MEEATGLQYMMSAVKRKYADRIPTTMLSPEREYAVREVV